MITGTRSNGSRQRHFLLLAFVLLSACKATESASSPDASTPDSVMPLKSQVLAPGVVMEPDRGHVYVTRPAGGIRALRINDGTILWDSMQADLPLFATDDRLVGMVDAESMNLKLTVLNPDNGKHALSPEYEWSMPLPVGVSARIDDTLENRFRLNVQTSSNDIVLVWNSLQREVLGVAPDGKRATEKRADGAVLFRNDSFTPFPRDDLEPDTEDWPKELAQLDDPQRIRNLLLRSGETLAITEQQYGPDRLVLKRWKANDKSPLDRKVLVEGRAIAVLPSCDRQHVVVATLNPNEEKSRQLPYLLKYFEINGGRLIAELPSLRSAGPFCLLGERLFQLSQPELRRVDGVMIEKPLELVAVDIVEGAQIWRSEIRDLAFRGHAPPAN